MIYTTSGRLTDVPGHIPPGSIAVHKAQSMFKNHQPYTFVGRWDAGYTINFEFNFIKNLRRVLSGVTGDWHFSSEESRLYIDFIQWVSDDVVYGGEREVILQELDNWLTVEIEEGTHYEMPRSYAKPTPWV